MKEYLISVIKDALLKNDIDYSEIEIEKTKDSTHGDYASNIAMKLTKVLRKNPKDIANTIISSIDDEKIEKVQIAGPGFINFFLKQDYLYENLDKVLEEKENYGSTDINKEKVIVEYVSANPTGTLHIGHARGAAYGDSISRILSFTGSKVTRQYYINDAGVQMNKLGMSINARYHELCGKDMQVPEGGYQGQDVVEIAKLIKEEFKDTKLEETTEYFKQYGLTIMMDKIKEDLAKFKVEFDVWTSEQELYDSGRVSKVLKDLEGRDATFEEDGALWLKTMEHGDTKNRVLVKNDGTYTYFLPDIAGHLYKIELGNDKLINEFGADHHGYVARLKAALEIFGYSKDMLDVEIHQMVRMVRDGQEVKMSKRTGNAYTISDLIDEVGPDASRYFFAAKSLDTQMDFDLDLATKKTSDNPVYYIQYAYARISSILSENDKGVKIDNYKTLTTEYDKELMNKIYGFNATVLTAANKKAPHIVANYVYDLATAFHSFYSHEKVLTDDQNYTNERINLIKATAITIKNALNLIGVDTKEHM
jgi:arginyl-tRNA synthetase